MAGDSVKVQGLENVLKKLKALPRDVQKYGGEARDKSLKQLRQRAEDYPPRRPSSRYRRTGLLGRGWAEQRRGLFGGRIYNRVPYARWVQGAKYQAQVHRGRWSTTERLAAESQQKIVRFYEAAIDEAVKKANG